MVRKLRRHRPPGVAPRTSERELHVRLAEPSPRRFERDVRHRRRHLCRADGPGLPGAPQRGILYCYTSEPVTVLLQLVVTAADGQL